MDQATGMRHGLIELRLVRSRDARALQHELLSNRSWLQPWEATVPYGSVSFDMRLSIRRSVSYTHLTLPTTPYV